MAEGPDEHTARTKRLIAERNYDEAIRVSRRALLTRPDMIPVRLLLGEALLATGRYEQVRVEMMALARKHPNAPGLHRLMGEAYLRAGQMPKAKESLRRAIELDPGDDVARDLLGEAAEEDAPVSQTIERWFGDDEPKTVEQDLPPHFEESTPLPRALPVDASTAEPSVQIDPALAAEAAAMGSAIEPPTAPRASPLDGGRAAPPTAALLAPSVRAPSSARRDEAPRAGAPIPARPGQAAAPIAPRPSAPRAAPPSAPPRISSRPPSLPMPGRAVASSPQPSPFEPHPAPNGAPSHASSSFPPPSASREAATQAGRPRARPEPSDPTTDQLDIADLDARADPSLDDFDAQLEQDDDDEEQPTLLGRRPASLAPASAPAAPPPAGAPPLAQRPITARAAPAPSPSPSHAGNAPAPRAAPPPRSERPPSMALPALAQPTFPPPAAVPRDDDRLEGRPPAPERPVSVETVMRPTSDIAVGAPRPFLGGARTPATARAIEPPTDPRRGERSAVPLDGKPETTTETTRRPRKLVGPTAIAIVGVALLIAVLSAIGLRAYLRSGADEAIRAAALTAGADGRRASIERAVRLIDDTGGDPWHAALRARLLATLTLEHSQDLAGEVESSLAGLEREGAALPDARVARSLLLVAQGRGADALGVLSGLAASGDELAEAFRARAWAAASAGRIAEAEESARQALAVRPGTARHASLHAVLRFRAGDAASALQVLDTVPNGATSPAVRIARARVLLESGGDPAGAAAEAEAVLTELTPSATPVELGWAHLVRARLAAARGDLAVARAEALEASARAPAFDESYGLSVIETLLAGGAYAEAREALGRLPTPPIEAIRRAGLAAEASLAANDLTAAETALMSAGAGPRADLLRGRLREARGDLDAARQLYERAAVDAGQALEARTRAGSVLLRLSRAREARVQLDAALRLSPADVEVVTLFVRAALATGDAAAAETALQAALAQRPDAIDLVAARGSVLLALDRPGEAITVLQQACAARPEDAALRVELGDAALRAGRRDVSGEAFREAIRLSPTLSRAHLGMAQLALEDGRWDEASAALDAAERHAAPSIDAARLRAELAVAQGLGAGAVESIEQLLTRHPRDGSILASLGHLLAQAEEDRDARDAFTRALRADDESYEALLGRAGIEIRRGDLGGAARSIDRAERAARQRGAPSSFSARVSVARARLRFEVGGFDEARRLAEEAIATDPKCAEAHVVLANIAVERGGDPIPHFRAAIAGTRVPPEALGRLAVRLGGGSEVCTLGRRYVAAAPEGYDREDVNRAMRRCR